MIFFWLAGAAMLAAALAFVLPPLLRSSVDHGPSRQQTSVRVYQERRHELDLLEESGGLDAAQAALAREELDREMLSQTVDSQAPSSDAKHSTTTVHPIVAVIVAVSLPMLAIGMYLQVGTPSVLFDQSSPNASVAGAANPGADRQQPSIEQMVARLEQRLREQPDDVRGWLMLGRSYSVMQRPTDARTALARAYELAPDDPLVIIGYAEVLTTLNNGSLDGEPIKLVNRALAIQPDNPRAHWLTGLHAINQGLPSQALSAWQKVIDSAGLDEGVRAQVVQAMKSIQTAAAKSAAGENKANLSGTAADTDAAQAVVEAKATQQPAAAVRISVSLSAELKAQVSGTETVFVFARASNGPPMPLAVQRLTASQLPTTVVLNDANSMTAQLAISSFDSVVITARISRAGTPKAAPGDLQGISDEVATRGGDAVNLVINQRVE